MLRFLLPLAACLGLLLPSQGCGDDGSQAPGPGPYDVGFREVTINYEEAGTGDPRALLTRIWYPAELQGDEALAGYVVSLLVAVDSDVAHADAPVAPGGPYPVAVYSHGSGGEGLLAYPYGELMASNGWIVISPNHVGNTALDDVGLGAGRSPRPQILVNRPRDLSAMLDYLEAGLDPGDPLVGQAATDEALVIGHSFGGYAAFAVAGADVDLDLVEARCTDEDNAELVDRCRFIQEDSNRKTCENAEEPPAQCALFDDEELPDACDDASGLVDECTLLADPAFRAAFDGEFLDPRVQAIVPQAPALVAFGAGELASIDVPVLIQSGGRDQTTTREGSAIPAWEGTDGPEDVWIDMADAGHFSFITICTDLDIVVDSVNELFGLDEGTTLLAALRPGAVEDGCAPTFTPSSEVVSAAARYALAFGEQHVLGDESAARVFSGRPLVDGADIVTR